MFSIDIKEKYIPYYVRINRILRDFPKESIIGGSHTSGMRDDIKKTMEQLNDGDVLLYLDCGCEINFRKNLIINEYIEKVKKELIIATKTGYNSIYTYSNGVKINFGNYENMLYTFNECEWVKTDLFLKMDMLDTKYIYEEQYQAGAIMFLICNKTREFVNTWYELSCDYHNIDDSPSIKPNFHCFREHRHDQSIFSLLLRKNNIVNDEDLHMCIEYARNKTGKSNISE